MPQVLLQLLHEDRRYKLDAYLFVRDALAYAHDVMEMGGLADSPSASEESGRHVTGQQLCEAMRRFALEQYGMLAKVVLNSWGLYSTGDFGEVVYNLIRVEMLKQSESDRREDFDDVFDFDDAFQHEFQITVQE